MSIAEVSVSRPETEVERLRAEIETLKERLEIAESKPLLPHPPGRVPWTFFCNDEGVKKITAAIESLDFEPLTGDIEDADRLTDFCSFSLFRDRKRDSLRSAAEKWNHAGMAWLATECDWEDVANRYGVNEAADLVDSLRRTSGHIEVGQIVEAFFDEGE